MKYDELLTILRECNGCRCEEHCPYHEERNNPLRCMTKIVGDAADAIEEQENKLNLWRQDKISRWIPVEERLPDYDKVVLCHCRANIIETLCLENDGHWYGYSGRYMKGFVTHWMPLPEPPKDGE